MEARGSEIIIFKVLTENNCQPRMGTSKTIFQNEGERKDIFR